MCGAAPTELAQLLDRLPPGLHDIPALLDTALADCIDETLFDRLHPAMQADLLGGALDRLGVSLNTGIGLDAPFVRARAARLVDDESMPHTQGLRWSFAFDRLMADDAPRRGPDGGASVGPSRGAANGAPHGGRHGHGRAPTRGGSTGSTGGW